jgi:hypothetical protein
MGATHLLPLLLIRPAKFPDAAHPRLRVGVVLLHHLVNRAAARFILRTGSAGSKGYDPPLRPANFPSPRIFVFA